MNCSFTDFYENKGELSCQLNEEEQLHLQHCDICSQAYLQKIAEKNKLRRILREIMDSETHS